MSNQICHFTLLKFIIAFMLLSNKIKNGIVKNIEITRVVFQDKINADWSNFTRTNFNNIAQVINKKITKAVIINPDLVDQFIVVGKLKIEKDILNLRCGSVTGFIKHLNDRSEYQIYNWISGKTLQSYWNDGDAKMVKINALLVFLQVPFKDWNNWISEAPVSLADEHISNIFQFKIIPQDHSSFSILKKYYVGNYYLYYQKTDGSQNIIKTPFLLKEDKTGQILMHSVSEGHHYNGMVMGVKDGCLYINCQNVDFEEMEQYVFNIGLETKPEVLFGVSTTISVKERLGVALKNVLVKQKTNVEGFEKEREIEISFSKKYEDVSEESIIVAYLKNSFCNIIKTQSCCNLSDLVNIR